MTPPRIRALPTGPGSFAPGSVFALLGPNGAGKTTAVKILCTLIGADGGQAQVAGHDVAAVPDRVRAAIGVTGQFSAVDGLITGRENMLLMADLNHLSRGEVKRVEAEELADRIAVLDNGKIVAEGSAEELKRMIPGGHIRLRFTDPSAYQSAATAFREVQRDDEALALQIPNDGSQRELRSILDRLDSAGIEADELTVHTPDLDDVFFALTDGNTPTQAQEEAAR